MKLKLDARNVNLLRVVGLVMYLLSLRLMNMCSTKQVGLNVNLNGCHGSIKRIK